MQSLRDRQIREILDEDKIINQRVFDREKEQVRVFDEVVLPKKTRDIDAEIGVDKLIESINKILENKISSLEYLLSKITSTKDIGDAEGRRSYNNIISNGDFITAFNQLVRIYTTVGISRNSQEIIKVKFQEIKPNIDAIIYGIEELVQYLFESGKSDKEIFQLIRSQAVYQIVKDQLYRSSSYKIIEQGDIQVSIREVLSELSEVQRMELRDISEGEFTERSLLKLPIEIGKDEERIRQLEEEMGFRLPEGTRSQLSELGRAEKEQAISIFGNIREDVSTMNRQEQERYMQEERQRKDVLVREGRRLKSGLMKASKELRTLKAQQNQLIQGQPQFRGDEKEEDDDVEIPLAGDIKAKQDDINAINVLIRKNSEAQQSLQDEIDRNNELYEENLEDNLQSEVFRRLQEELPLRKKRVKNLKEQEQEPEDAEEKEAPAPAEPKKKWYTKAYLNGLKESQLRAIASTFNYTPRSDTPLRVIINRIIDLQPPVPERNRIIVGMGYSGGDAFSATNQVYNDIQGFFNKLAGKGLKQNPMTWRGLSNRREYMPDYGYEGYDYDNMYDDRRNDIYHIQQQLKRGY